MINKITAAAAYQTPQIRKNETAKGQNNPNFTGAGGSARSFMGKVMGIATMGVGGYGLFNVPNIQKIAASRNLMSEWLYMDAKIVEYSSYATIAAGLILFLVSLRKKNGN